MIAIEKVPEGTFVRLPDDIKKLATLEVQDSTAFKVEHIQPVYYDAHRVYVKGNALHKRRWVQTAFWVTTGLPVDEVPPARLRFLQNSFDKYRAKNIGNSIKNVSVKFGGDPEIFVENAKSEVIPSTEFLPDKKKPLYSTLEHTHVYWDGFQAEMAFEPVTCICWVSDYVREGLIAILNAARAKFPDAKLSAKTVVPIPTELLNKGPKHLLDLGCKPSYNAYDLAPLDPTQAKLVPFRCAGAHIHASPDFLFRQKLDVYKAMAKAIDRTLGVLSVSLLDGFEDPIRRQFYGKPGEFRTPPHGFEYRVMSNAIIFHPAILHLIYDLYRSFTRFHHSNLDKFWLADEQEVIETITNYDVKQARAIIERNKCALESVIRNTFAPSYRYEDEDDIENDTWYDRLVKSTMQVLREGIIPSMKHPFDIEKNWSIDTGEWISHSENEEAQWGYATKLIASGEKI